MTSSDPVSLGTHAMLGLTLGILLILVIRAGVMRLFGPPIAYALWWIVPAWMVASLLPTRSLNIAHPQLIASARMQVDRVIATTVEAHGLAWTSIGIGLWLLGAMVMPAVSLKAWINVRRAIRRAKPPASFEGIAVLSSTHWPHGPAVAGIWRPTIVVPSDFEQRYTANERRLILAQGAAAWADG
jgi:beta-lactamase regulating signal transducer with metallopeptidase domain